MEAPKQKIFTFTGHRCGLLVSCNIFFFELTDLLSLRACVTHHENIFHHRHTQLGGCFIFFTSTWGNDPIWTFAYFSVGLVQPPPSQGEIDPGDRKLRIKSSRLKDSGQIIATSHDLTPNGGDCKGNHRLFQGSPRLVKYYSIWPERWRTCKSHGPSYGLKGFQPAWDVRSPQEASHQLLGLGGFSPPAVIESGFFPKTRISTACIQGPRLMIQSQELSGICIFPREHLGETSDIFFFDKTDWEINHRPQNKTGSNTKSWADVAG